MLKSELSQLEKLIGEALDMNRTTDVTGTHKRLTEQVKSIQSSCEYLKGKWVHELFSSAKDLVINRYVQYHQAGITQLSDRLSRELPAYYSTTEKSAPIASGYGQILHELEQLLHFLKHQCYSYFDPDYHITIYNCHRQCKKIDDLWREIISYPAIDIEPALVATIAVSVQEITAEALHSGLSYRRAEHALSLLRMIQRLLHKPGGTTTDALARTLYRQNMNTLHFLDWYQDRILFRLNQLPDKGDQETFLRQKIKALSVIFVDPEKALEPDRPSINQALLAWLQEKTESRGFRNDPISKEADQLRLALNLSVRQFALFIRIFSQAGCFPETNVAKIARFFTGHFSTKRQHSISFKSFARAFYNLDQMAAAVVRDYLQKMINYLDKTYFP